jgi:hypothetical protein
MWNMPMTDKPKMNAETSKSCCRECESVADGSTLMEKLERFNPLIHGGEIMSSGLVGTEIIKGGL